MAATDYSTVTRGSGARTRRATLPSTAGNVREIILPAWVRRVVLTSRDSGGTSADFAVATEGTDDTAQAATAFRYGAGAGAELTLAAGGSLYVSGSSSATVDLLLLRV